VEDELNVAKNKIDGMWNNVERKVQDACHCINYNCGCCAHLEEKEIELNSTSKTVMVTEHIFCFI
jgi:GH24 family phage-related lysozyme (muramidase)